MASRMIGRTACPECGFKAAHVKESEKCLYRYCPDCNSQHYAKSERQRADLMAKTRPDAGATGSATVPETQALPVAQAPGATGSDHIEPKGVAPETVQQQPEAAPKKRRGLFA